MGIFEVRLIVEAVQWFCGGWDSRLQTLAMLTVVEAFLSIVLAVRKRSCLKQRCLQIIGRTMMIFLVVGTAHAIDCGVGENGVLRVITVGYYIAYEGNRILGVAARARLPIPPSLKGFIQGQHKDNID